MSHFARITQNSSLFSTPVYRSISPLSSLCCINNRECAAGDCPSLPAKMDFGSEDFCRPCKNSRNNNLRGRSSNGSGSSSTILFCANTSIQRISYPLSEVFKTGSCGYGLRISEDIEIGKVVVEYTGEVITAAECSERMKGMKGRSCMCFSNERLSIQGNIMSISSNKTKFNF